jgi:CRISPR/Cas system-associated endoribonuclease Cas2
VEECGPCPIFASFTLAFALQLRKKHGKPSVRVRKTSVRLRKTTVRVQYTYYSHITKPSQTHTHAHTHTLQNNIKPPQYKLKQNAYRKSNTMGRKNST